MPPPDAPECVGIDVGLRRLHAVVLGEGSFLDARNFASDDIDELLDWASPAGAIAVDAPDGWSTAPHHTELSLPPKFRTARCAEIGLGRQFGFWVSWTTPVDPRPGSWMGVGVALFTALRAAGHDPVEVYPFAACRSLAGDQPLPKKQSPAGRHARTALLAAAGVNIDTTSHDVIDAAVAALVASHHADGRAIKATCGHDGSAIWLPAGVPETPASL